MADARSLFRFSWNIKSFSRHKMILSVFIDNVRFGSTTSKKRAHFLQRTRRTEDNIKQTRGQVEMDYASFRIPSERLRQLRNYYFSKASQAYSRGQGNMAKRMSSRGWMIHSAMQHTNRQCVNDILKMTNLEYDVFNTSMKTLNLHGLRVKEAMNAVEEFLEEQSEHRGRLRIISGWGNNSYPRKPQLLPALKEMLMEQGRHFREIQPGVIEVIN